jgi:hypothetical protein
MLLSQLTPDPRDQKLLVYRELQAFREDFNNHISGWSTVFSLIVIRHGTIISRQVFNSFSFADLDRELGALYLTFPERPNGMHFILSCREFDTYGRLVETFVQFDGLVQTNYKLIPKGKASRTSSAKAQKFVLHLHLPLGAKATTRRIRVSMRRQSSLFGRKTGKTTRTNTLSIPSKGLRANPEQQAGTYLIRNTNSNGFDGHYLTPFIPYSRSYTSVRTPGFKKKSHDGTLPINPYSMSLYRMNDGEYQSRTDSVTNGTPGWGIIYNTIAGIGLMDVTPQPHYGSRVNPAIAKLAGKINAANVNLGEDLSTANQTLRLFTNNVTRIGKAFQLLKQGYLKGSMKQLGKPLKEGSIEFYNELKKGGKSGIVLAAEMWLELRYGWMPLVSDIHGSMKIFSQALVKSPVVYYVHASSTVNDQGVVPLSFDSLANGYITGKKYYTVKSTTKFGLYYKVDDVIVNKLAQLGLTSPTLLAWELLPYSFIVDWFLPIGQALEAFSDFDGLVFVKGYKTQITKTYISVVFNSDEYVQTAPGFSTRRRNTGNASEELVKFDRTILTDFPAPNFPRPKNPLSYIHAANAVALLITRFSR